MMGYDVIAAGFLHSFPPPHGYIVDVVEKEDMRGCMFLRVYADDINDKPDSHAESLASWLNDSLDKLNRWTTAVWSWEMAEKPRHHEM